MRQICDEFVEMAKYVNLEDDNILNNNERNGGEQLFVVKRGETVCEARIQFINFIFNLKYLVRKEYVRERLNGEKLEFLRISGFHNGG